MKIEKKIKASGAQRFIQDLKTWLSSAECTPECRSQGFKVFPPDNVAAKIKLVLKNNPYYACSLNKSEFFFKYKLLLFNITFR